MDFQFSEEERGLLDLIETVAERQLRPHAGERRTSEDAPRDNLRVLGQAGILGLSYPEEDGGSARPPLESIIAVERIATACPGTADYATMSITGPAMFISRFGSRELREKYVPPVIAGEAICSISLTEPSAGSSLTDLRTNARIEGDRCILNGHKIFCSLANHADWILVFTRFAEGTNGIGAVIIDREAPGLTIGKTYYHFGATPWAELYFDNAEIPLENVLIQGNAFAKLMESYSLERCTGAANVLGIAQHALELSIEYVLEREQFGRPIVEFQMVQSKLADMYIALEQARLLNYRAVSVIESNGLPSRIAASAAKVAATEAACFVTDQAMQIHGGSGMTPETGVEWLYRLVRPHRIAGGTSEIHRGIIASELVGRRFDQRRQ